MFAVRRATRAGTSALRGRGNASLSTGSPEPVAAPVPPAAAAIPQAQATPSEQVAARPKPTSSKAKAAVQDVKPPKRRGPYRFWPTTRPSISLERPRQYSRPIGVGVLPAYDEALLYIKRDSEMRKVELDGFKSELEAAQSAGNVEEVERLQEKVRILEVQSEVNLPSVRWKAKNGLADMSKTVYRHLLEQRWRDEGALDLLMERIHQMNVVPDMMGEMHPSFDLRVNFPQPPPQDAKLRSRTRRKYEKVEPGVFLLPEQTRKQPQLYTTVFHPEPRLYTLLMIDLDVPDPEIESFQSYLHWLQPNVSLSASTTTIDLPAAHTKYIPPHPQKGTPYHRYVLVFVPQTGSEPIKVPQFSDEDRLGFDYREFAEQYGLDASKGGAAHMWREIWDETVGKIYKEVLQTEEPVFGRMPRVDPYKEMKKEKKYI